jgi:hypothetical protein
MFRTTIFVATIIWAVLLSSCGGGGSATISGATPKSLTLAADRSAALADGSDTINITATVKDEIGNPLQGKEVTFTVDLPGSSQIVVSTDVNGHSVFKVKRTPQQLAMYGGIVNVTASCADRGSWVAVRFTAGPIIDLFDDGGGIFTLTGKGLLNITSMDIQVGYETASLANPQVQWGDLVSSSTNTADTPGPGTIRVTFVSPVGILGTGRLATLRFDEIGSSFRKINSLGASLIDPSGNSISTDFVMPPSTTSSRSN